MKTYSEFKNEASSEKLMLTIVKGKRQLAGFTKSGSNYILTLSSSSFVSAVYVNDISLSNNTSLSSDYSYHFNEETKELSLRLPVGMSPNKETTYSIEKFFFSDKSIALPHDLNEGFEVYFEPLIVGSSLFSSELDILNESLSSIEGEGIITFFNDKSYWSDKYDSVFFENQLAEVYSYSQNLPVQHAKVLFRGYVDSKSFDSDKIKIKIKDLFYSLRGAISLETVGSLGERNEANLANAKQRLLYGFVQGHRPINLDSLIDRAYPLTGTLNFYGSSASVIGVSTQFKKELIKTDKIRVGGIDYTVANILSDTALELTSPFLLPSTSFSNALVVPSINKSYMNRRWLVSGHALSKPKAMIEAGTSTQVLMLNSTQDIFDGDDLYIGSFPNGELVTVSKVINEKVVRLATSTQSVYDIGTQVERLSIKNVRLNDLELPTSLSEEEYINLETLRAEAADRVVGSGA